MGSVQGRVRRKVWIVNAPCTERTLIIRREQIEAILYAVRRSGHRGLTIGEIHRDARKHWRVRTVANAVSALENARLVVSNVHANPATVANLTDRVDLHRRFFATAEDGDDAKNAAARDFQWLLNGQPKKVGM